MKTVSTQTCFRKLAPFVLLAAVSGCGDPAGVPVARVSGLVTHGGAPLAEAEVSFVNTDRMHVANAVTDDQGRFELEAAVGTNRVAVSKWSGEALDADEGLDAGQAAAMGMGGVPGAPELVVPPQYAEADQSPLSFVVPEEGAESAAFEIPQGK